MNIAQAARAEPALTSSLALVDTAQAAITQERAAAVQVIIILVCVDAFNDCNSVNVFSILLQGIALSMKDHSHPSFFLGACELLVSSLSPGAC